MEKRFPVAIDSLHDMLEFIREYAAEQNFGVESLQKVKLAADEALANIIHHSGLKNHDHLEISCYAFDNNGVKIVIKDSGIPYNPLEGDHSKGIHFINDRSPGGCGVFLILNLMDKVEYRREDGVNILTLVKYI